MFYSISRQPTLRISKIEGIAYIHTIEKVSFLQQKTLERTLDKNRKKSQFFAQKNVGANILEQKK